MLHVPRGGRHHVRLAQPAAPAPVGGPVRRALPNGQRSVWRPGGTVPLDLDRLLLGVPRLQPRHRPPSGRPGPSRGRHGMHRGRAPRLCAHRAPRVILIQRAAARDDPHLRLRSGRAERLRAHLQPLFPPLHGVLHDHRRLQPLLRHLSPHRADGAYARHTPPHPHAQLLRRGGSSARAGDAHHAGQALLGQEEVERHRDPPCPRAVLPGHAVLAPGGCGHARRRPHEEDCAHDSLALRGAPPPPGPLLAFHRPAHLDHCGHVLDEFLHRHRRLAHGPRRLRGDRGRAPSQRVH
mmetsp:Transcript_20415/g.54963  ORF Transcript_20415/g.54963 Transcript_20415/m.54963 type:complete len:294 (+) Transcript_20415:124-1005(+)